jgi:hypothetical protein
MKIRIELDEKDLSAAISAYARDVLGMTTSGPVSLTASPGDRNGPTIFSASVMAEPVKKANNPGNDR